MPKKKTKTKKKKTGRPLVNIDQGEFEKLCNMQCTKPEIEGWFGVTDKTIDRFIKETYGSSASFSDIFNQKRGKGKVSLRRAQFQKALDGHPTMLIWLGKQYLDQSEKMENKNLNKEVTGITFVEKEGEE